MGQLQVFTIPYDVSCKLLVGNLYQVEKVFLYSRLLTISIMGGIGLFSTHDAFFVSVDVIV